MSVAGTSGPVPSVRDWCQHGWNVSLEDPCPSVSRILLLLSATAAAGMAYGMERTTSALLAGKRPPFRLDSGMDMPPDEPIHSTGWSRLGDLELAQWYAEYNDNSLATFEMLLSEGTRELEKRGMVLKNCSECGHRRMNYNHDYMCILCRRAW